MTGNEYQKLAMRTANEKCFNLANAGLGLSGEAGEATDIIKKHLFHGHELEKEHLAKELGDVMWYIALVATIIGFVLWKEDFSIIKLIGIIAILGSVFLLSKEG